MPHYCEKDEEEVELHDPEFLTVDDFEDKCITFPTPPKEYEDPKIEVNSPMKNNLRQKTLSKDIRKKNRVKSVLDLDFLREARKSNIHNLRDDAKELDAVHKFAQQIGASVAIPGKLNLKLSGYEKFESGSFTTKNKKKPKWIGHKDIVAENSKKITDEKTEIVKNHQVSDLNEDKIPSVKPITMGTFGVIENAEELAATAQDIREIIKKERER
jgi:hypothetical protein